VEALGAIMTNDYQLTYIGQGRESFPVDTVSYAALTQLGLSKNVSYSRRELRNLSNGTAAQLPREVQRQMDEYREGLLGAMHSRGAKYLLLEAVVARQE